MGNIILKTERLLLRQIVESDIENIYKGLSHPQVIQHYGVSYKSLEETQEQMRWFRGLEENNTGIWFAICSPDNSIFYGAGGLNNVHEKFKKAEIGFWLLKEYWGLGFMTEAMPIICNFGFEQLGLHRIEAFVETDNWNCKNAMKKLNFQLEGTMKDCEIKNDRYISLEFYAKFQN